MHKHLKFLKAAKKEALKSDFKWQFGAIITDKSKIISRGRNFQDHTRVPRIFKKDYSMGLHAEIHAILQSDKNVKGLTIFVYGQNKKSKNVLHSKPCILCLNYLIKKGIKNIYFATKESYGHIKL